MRIPPVSHLPDMVKEGSRRLLHLTSAITAVTCALGAVYLGWDLWGSGWYAARQQAALADQLAQVVQVEGLPSGTVRVVDGVGPRPDPVILAEAATLSPGEPVGRIVIERIGVDAAVVYGTGVEQLRQGPGLWEWGVLPGEPGNALIAGHRNTYGAPFRRLHELVPGDRIRVTIPGREVAVFEVRETQVVAPEEVSVSDQTPGVRLTLSACHPIGSDRERIVVQAELVEGPATVWAVPAEQWTFQR